MKPQNKKREANQYDKIFKENIEAVISSIMQNVLEITATSMEKLPDDIQHTKERKPDTLKKITDDKGNTFVLQIEFQVKNDDEMVHRMLDYKVMLFRKYLIPVRQYVIYLGKDKLTMESSLQTLDLTFKYNLLALNTIDYKIFLNSNQPKIYLLKGSLEECIVCEVVNKYFQMLSKKEISIKLWAYMRLDTALPLI